MSITIQVTGRGGGGLQGSTEGFVRFGTPEQLQAVLGRTEDGTIQVAGHPVQLKVMGGADEAAILEAVRLPIFPSVLYSSRIFFQGFFSCIIIMLVLLLFLYFIVLYLSFVKCTIFETPACHHRTPTLMTFSPPVGVAKPVHGTSYTPCPCSGSAWCALKRLAAAHAAEHVACADARTRQARQIEWLSEMLAYRHTQRAACLSILTRSPNHCHLLTSLLTHVILVGVTSEWSHSYTHSSGQSALPKAARSPVLRTHADAVLACGACRGGCLQQ